MLLEWFLINAVKLYLLLLYLCIKFNLQKKKEREREKEKRPKKKYNSTKRLKQIRCQKREWVLDIDTDQVTVTSWGTPWGPDSIFLQATLQGDVPSHLSPTGPRGPQLLTFRFILIMFHLPTCVWTHRQRTQEQHQWAGVAPVTAHQSWVGGQGLELTWRRTGIRGEGQGERKSASCTGRPSEITKSDFNVYFETSLFASVTKYCRYTGLKEHILGLPWWPTG